MAFLQITQYAGIFVKNDSEIQAAQEPEISNAIVDCTSAAEVDQLNERTRLVKILAIGGDVHVDLGPAGGTAATEVTTSNQRYVQGVPEWRVMTGDMSALSYYGLTAT